MIQYVYVFFYLRNEIAVIEIPANKNGNEVIFLKAKLALVARVKTNNPPSFFFLLSGIYLKAIYIWQVKKHTHFSLWG